VALRKVIHAVDEGRLIDLGGYLKAAPTKWESREEAPEIQQRIWRAAVALTRKSPRWEHKECALLANASPAYTAEYLKYLKMQKYVTAQQRPGKTTLYTVRHDAPGPAPIYHNTKNRALRKRQRAARKGKESA
jgi:hypothetical protein